MTDIETKEVDVQPRPRWVRSCVSILNRAKKLADEPEFIDINMEHLIQIVNAGAICNYLREIREGVYSYHVEGDSDDG